MDLIVAIFVGPIQLFVWHPMAALAVAVAFAYPCFTSAYGLGAKVTLGVVAGIWFIYTLIEAYATWKARAVPDLMRADLVLLGPILVIVSVVGAAVLIRGRKSAA